MRLLTLLIVALAMPAAAGTPAAGRLDNSVRGALGAQGPIVTAADDAVIARKCGLPSTARSDRNISLDDKGLRCPDGRIVDDAETRAMSARISARAKAHVRAVMRQPGVTAAVEAVADEASLATLRRLRAR